MWAFDQLLDFQTDVSGRIRARVQLKDDADGAVETFSLKFPSLPTVPQRTAAVLRLVGAINAARYPPPKPQWDGILPDAVKTALINHGVYAVTFNDQVRVLLQ